MKPEKGPAVSRGKVERRMTPDEQIKLEHDRQILRSREIWVERREPLGGQLSLLDRIEPKSREPEMKMKTAKVKPRVTDLGKAPAITLWAPWSHAVACGLKRFETRGRRVSHRGLIFIHAAQRWEEDQEDFWTRAKNTLLGMDGVTREQLDRFWQPPPLGAIVAVADLVECWPTDGTPPSDGRLGLLDIMTDVERIFGDFSPGRFAYQLESVVRLETPVECDGRQGLWYPTADVVDRVKDQMRGVAS
jgi:hypothetical protein